MLRILQIVLGIVLAIHGLIHLMGLVAYWPLASISELPYKTTILGERINLGGGGMRAFSVLWLAAAIGFVAGGIALAAGKTYWPYVALAAAILSLILCVADWGVAFRGAVIDILILLGLVVVFGLRITPDPFPPYTAPSTLVQTVQFPAGLPRPVERYFHIIYGDAIPVYHSAVMSARGTLRFMGITFPARLRFIHNAGQGYRHYIEATFYGFPIMKVNEHYLDGHARMELPVGVVENDPGVDSAANQGLWWESLAYPAVLLTDPRVRWEAVDDTTARIYVPYGEDEQVFMAYFDPQSGHFSRFETLRYRDEKLGMVRWWGEIIQNGGDDSASTPAHFAVTWEDEGTPWLIFKIEDILFNSDVSQYIRATGP